MRDLRGLIKRDNYDEGGWCFDEKRKLITLLTIQTKSTQFLKKKEVTIQKKIKVIKHYKFIYYKCNFGMR